MVSGATRHLGAIKLNIDKHTNNITTYFLYAYLGRYLYKSIKCEKQPIFVVCFLSS